MTCSNCIDELCVGRCRGEYETHKEMSTRWTFKCVCGKYHPDLKIMQECKHSN